MSDHTDTDTDTAQDREPTHFAELVARYSQGRKIADMERTAGFRIGTMRYYLQKGTRPARIPPAKVINDFATIIGAPVEEVSIALAKDMGIPIGPVTNTDLSEVERRMIVLLRQLPAETQDLAVCVVHAMTEHAANKQPLLNSLTRLTP